MALAPLSVEEAEAIHVAAPEQAVLDLVYAVEAGATAIADVAAWLRQHTTLAP